MATLILHGKNLNLFNASKLTLATMMGLLGWHYWMTS